MLIGCPVVATGERQDDLILTSHTKDGPSGEQHAGQVLAEGIDSASTGQLAKN